MLSQFGRTARRGIGREEKTLRSEGKVSGVVLLFSVRKNSGVSETKGGKRGGGGGGGGPPEEWAIACFLKNTLSQISKNS